MTLVFPSSPFPHLVLQGTCKSRAQHVPGAANSHASNDDGHHVQVHLQATEIDRAETIPTDFAFGACCVGRLVELHYRCPTAAHTSTCSEHAVRKSDPPYWLWSCDLRALDGDIPSRCRRPLDRENGQNQCDEPHYCRHYYPSSPVPLTNSLGSLRARAGRKHTLSESVT